MLNHIHVLKDLHKLTKEFNLHESKKVKRQLNEVDFKERDNVFDVRKRNFFM